MTAPYGVSNYMYIFNNGGETCLDLGPRYHPHGGREAPATHSGVTQLSPIMGSGPIATIQRE